MVADPGFSVVTPGSGVIMIMPGLGLPPGVDDRGRPPPMCSRYQIQASGLIGSPTEPEQAERRQIVLSAYSGPHFMCERIAVGAV